MIYVKITIPFIKPLELAHGLQQNEGSKCGQYLHGQTVEI
jgi:hypothetical protein